MSLTVEKHTLQDKLNLSLKEIYPLAQAADEQLDALVQEEKGQFSSIFQVNSGFKTTAKRFLPYLVELSEDVKKLPDPQSNQFTKELRRILGNIKQMQLILERFHSIKS